ncbi:MAG: CpXC domain-containing protein [Anaerolineales bacterium]|nr:CpXC domain-containing protein [Anaerolineales bacterium]MCX7755505.1 CpXC domain-containing protein [Anaerolineales bacterium]MDW8278245.1 CpXC domain-containing protein [Anaerolineales bacterium]
MPQTQIACPRCRQMIPAQVEQLFDVTADPGAKQRLLGRTSNYARCPYCKFEGPLATPIVYHDNEKELLLTYFPPELGLPVNEQEKLIGPLISQVMNRLPPEKRKAYLLRPQSFLTYQSLIEKILEKDGISKEMLDEQQKRVSLIQRLLEASSPDVRAAIIKENTALLDETFFALYNRLIDAALQSGQQQTAQAMAALQEELLEHSDYGRKVREQMGELEAAVKTLQQARQGLTREKLLEIFLAAPTEERLKALVSLTRNGLDYSFFQVLTDRIDHARGEERARLEDLRTKLLEYVNQIDKAIEEQMKQADKLIESILAAPDILKAAVQNLAAFQSDLTLQVLESKLQEASRKQDTARMQKLQQLVAILQQASTPPEVTLINELLDAADDETVLAHKLQQHEGELTEEFNSMIAGLMNQVEQQAAQDPNAGEVLKRLETVYRAVLKRSMEKNIRQ